jgi:anti-anti-sigma factor
MTMNAEFHVRVDSVGGPRDTPLVTAEGEIDLAAAAQLDEALNSTAEEHDQVTVDLRAVDYLDTAGIRVLFDHAGRGRLVVLITTNGIIAPVIATSGLGRVATVCTVDR